MANVSSSRILVTGASGYVGRKLVDVLGHQDWVDAVVGLDAVAATQDAPKHLFIERDIREPLADVVDAHQIDTLVHLAFIVAPTHDPASMEAVNVQGTRNVLEAAARANVKHLLYTSSAAAYGFHRDNDVPLTEESPLRGNDDVVYARSKRRTEELIAAYARMHPDTAVTVLRPCFVAGPGASHPLANHLRKKIVFLPRRTVPFQFVHEDDLVGLIVHLLARRQRGTYNVAGEGTIEFKEMVKALGNFRIPLSWPVIYAANHIAWKLRLRWITDIPSPALRMAVEPWLVSTKKLLAETGYRFRYDTKAAFADFVKSTQSDPAREPA
jgi:UDP-glucose 4-epimerase